MDVTNESRDFDVKSISSSSSEANGSSLNKMTDLPLVGKDTKDELPSLGMTSDIKNLWEGKRKCMCCVNCKPSSRHEC